MGGIYRFLHVLNNVCVHKTINSLRESTKAVIIYIYIQYRHKTVMSFKLLVLHNEIKT